MTSSASSVSGRARPARAGRRALLLATRTSRAPVPLSKDSAGEWTARFRMPAHGADSVSLKALTEAAGGLAVDQEIIRAFGLK